MSRKISILLGILLISGLLLSGCALTAQSAKPNPDRTITVVGSGEATAKPDKAYFYAGVEVTADTVQEATRRNNEVMQAIVAALTDMGVEEKDIQTSNFSVSLERGTERFPMSEKTKAGEEQPRYRVSNMVQVTVWDIEKVSELLDATINAGANNIWGITFTISETKALESEARAKAMQDARARAEELATLAGVSLGRIVSVSENVTGIPVLPSVAVERAAGMGGGPAISPGEASVRMRVQVTYAIE